MRGWLLVVVLGSGCNALLGIDEFHTEGDDGDDTPIDGAAADARLFDASDETVDAAPDVCAGGTATWTPLTPTASPPVRYEHVMAYTPVSQRILLFGGRDGPQNTDLLGDTWEFDGSTWIPQSPVGPPPPMSGAAMWFDEIENMVMIYGGRASGGGTEHTGYWTGGNWGTRDTKTTPSYRHDHAVAFDSMRDRAVLFGGFLGGVGTDGATWEYNPTGTPDWDDVSPSSGPSARLNHAMAYDAGRNVTVLFGGPDDETWEWDGASWSLKTTAPCTPPSANPTMAYDPSRGATVLFTGSEVWEWNGTAWTRVQTTGTPPPTRSESAMVYYPPMSRLVMFGGEDGTPLADTWTLD